MALTVDLFKESACDGCAAVNVEVGRCAAKHYTKPAAGPSPVVPWAPEQLIDEVCQRRCKCNYLNQNKTVLCSATPCIPPQLPECKDEAAAPGYNYCSLCGPKYNKPITIDMFECELGDNKCPGPNARPDPPTTTGTVGLVPLVVQKWNGKVDLKLHQDRTPGVLSGGGGGSGTGGEAGSAGVSAPI